MDQELFPFDHGGVNGTIGMSSILIGLCPRGIRQVERQKALLHFIPKVGPSRPFEQAVDGIA